MSFESVNPYTGEVLQKFEFDTADQLVEKIARADECYRIWRLKNLKDRCELMYKLADLIENNKLELGQIVSTEMGKPLGEAIAEAEKCALAARYFAKEAPTMLQNDKLKAQGKAEVVFGPIGVVFGIFPWNYPLWQVLRFAIPTVLAGNSVVFKHAENTPQSAQRIVNLFNEAGFPENLVQHLFANLEDIETIISNRAVRAVTLTGSERAGSSVASLAGKYIKKVVLELGGSDPCIILPDADLKKAAKISALSRFQNTGQSCIAAKRFIVHEEVYDKFLDLFVEEAKKFTPDNPLSEKTNMGTLARKDLADKVMDQIEDALHFGAQKILGAERLGPTTISPGILSDISPSSRIYHEELFGPVASFYRVKNEEEILLLANESNYGLGASIWTENMEKAKELAVQLECGMVYFNTMVKSTPELPFGGLKNSGIGKELSVYGIKEFTTHQLLYPL